MSVIRRLTGHLMLALLVSIPVANVVALLTSLALVGSLPSDVLEIIVALILFGPSVFTIMIVAPISLVMAPFINTWVGGAPRRWWLPTAVASGLALVSMLLWYLVTPFKWEWVAPSQVLGAAAYGAVAGYLASRRGTDSTDPNVGPP